MAVPPPSQVADKQAARRALRRRRGVFVRELDESGRLARARGAAAEHVLAHIPTGASVALYHAFGSELDPAPLARSLRARGHQLALPHVAADRTTMRFLAWSPEEELHAGLFGLHQPHAAAAEISPTVVLTPLVGFDRGGGRIGQGAGYYDRAFAALPGAIRIGFAWSVQELAHVPRDPWDVPLHAVATEVEWIAIGGAA